MKKKKYSLKAGARAGTYSAILTIVVIAVAIVVNLIVNSFPSKYLKIDTSANSMFTFDPKTEEFIAGVEEDVDVYHIVTKGAEDPYLTEILDRYADMNKHIKVQQIDLATNPTFAEKYTEESVAENSIIVENKDRYKIISASDIYYYYSEAFGQKMGYYDAYSAYVYYYQNYGIELEFSQIFAGESAVASAIDFVTKTDVPKIYFLSGHGEESLNADLTDWLKLQNYETETLLLSSASDISGSLGLEHDDITSQEVPEDADMVIITGLKYDITVSELEALCAYVERGGNLLVMSEYTMTGLTNFTSLAETYGLDINMSLAVEGDSSYYYRTPATVMAQISDHAIVSGLTNVYVNGAQGMKLAENMPEGMTATALLSTSDKGFAKKVGFNAQGTAWQKQEDGDIPGPVTLAAYVELEDAGSVTWLGSKYYLTSELTNEGLEYCMVFANSVAYGCGTTDTISVHTVEIGQSVLTVPDGSAGFWGIILIGVVPLTFIGIGLAVWMRRRSH